jgi:GNAT superfamily N-acetyltransferase
VGAWHDPAGEECYLASMTVDPDERRSGAGRFLLRETLSSMRERFPALRRAALLVNEAWPVAHRIYREDGFVVACRLPGFFRPENGAPQAGLVMEKEF